MAQLLQRGIGTGPYTNAVLRNSRDASQALALRQDGINYPDFAVLSIFKDLVLDLARQVCAERILDVSLICVRAGESLTLNAYNNRLILALENCASFSHDDNRFTPAAGDLLWTNEEMFIQNTGATLTLLLVIDFEEFLL